MTSVHIVGGNAAYRNMFINNGWDVVGFDEAEYIQFTGGEDVSPALYGEDVHPTTGHNPMRDAREVGLFARAVAADKKILGICRGGQFLSVMSGHSLWQNVDNHGIWDTHEAYVEGTDDVVQVSSTHHQMIRLDGATPYKLLVTADRSTRKEHGARKVDKEVLENVDVESVFFPQTNALSFQPHPEFFKPEHECQRLYFRLIEENFA